MSKTMTQGKTKKVRAKIGEYAMAVEGVGTQVVGTLYEVTAAAKRHGNGALVVRKDNVNTYRLISFFCPVREMIVVTTRALAGERRDTEADFGKAPSL